MPRQHTVDLYTFEELDPKAKERARDWWREVSAGDSYTTDLINEEFASYLEERGYPTEDIGWSLSYSQGDGVVFYGRCDTKKVLRNFNIETGFLRGTHDWQIDIDIPTVRGNYFSYNVLRAEVQVRANYDDAETRVKAERLEDELTAWVTEDIQKVSRALQEMGYSELEWANSDESIDDVLIGNEYEFYANGKRANV